MAKRLLWLIVAFTISCAAPGQHVRRLGSTPRPGPSQGDSLPAQAGNSGRFLKTDGSTPSWAILGGLSAGSVFFSLVDWSSVHDPSTAGTNGNYATGCLYYFAFSGTVSGVRWYQPSQFTSLSTRIELWSGTLSSMSLVEAVTLTPTQGAANAITFVSTHSFNAGELFGITAYDGSHQIIYNTTTGPLGNGVVVGANLYEKQCGYGSGDGWPSASSPGATAYYGIEPVYTVP